MAHAFEVTDTQFVIKIAGPLSHYDAQEIRTRINELQGSDRIVTLDLEHCDFLDSSALGLVTLLHNELGAQDFSVTNVQNQPAKLLQISKFHEVMTVDYL